ncbi:sigma 54-interacting transcriptional regulator [Proteiniborus sp. MB09-C3]|uniref:sigma 54-interacting transcriptional regulator n=1 Tax=Proteiniborus sp. MB09-C3 TaxID=3050072 RepID=UPI002557A2F6|nr:sigma 54-interacting transcriptional regulator [Proteiniborus sp. MB09-C3]WIV12980.1 sigma 54-interacting transcriptional regulator [Proteiniborus sp. MB09-C3]
MNEFIRFKIITEDRIGMTLAILSEIYSANINLNSLEVSPKKVCVKIGKIDSKKKNLLINKLLKINGVISIDEIELLSYETNERKLYAIINSVDDGIISINKDFKIEIFNNYCENIFNCKKEDVLGTDIRNLINNNSSISNLMRKENVHNNFHFNIENTNNKQYITTESLIKDDNDRTLGAVISIKDVKKTIQIANIISANNEGIFKDIVGNSPSIEKVKEVSKLVAKSDSTILLRGESGTGKELFAKAIQRLSSRKNKSFVTLNCAALPDSLIESELFGYEKGSFTGAIEGGKDGLFKEADGGTLFLDEIGELSGAMQAKLLRALQEKSIRKIGSTKEEEIDVRIIAATNKNLEEMIDNNTFREDLYYRLNVIPIHIPPLRDRLDDIPLLVSFFINKLNKKLDKKVEGAEIEFINRLMKHNWHGNVRELQNVIERAMNLCENKLLKTDNLIITPHKNISEPQPCMDFSDKLSLREVIEDCEKKTIINALRKNKSIRSAAKILGVSHTTIINKIKRYNIKW